MLKKCLVWVLIFVYGYSYGQNVSSTITTAVPFVVLSADPVSGAMGDAGIGALPNANAPFWNIAKTNFLDKKYNFSLNYSKILANLQIPNLYLLNFSGVYLYKEQHAFSVFGKYFNIGNIKMTSDIGEVLGETKPNEFLAGLGYSFKVNKYFSLGASLKAIFSNLMLGATTASTTQMGRSFAADVGIYYRYSFNASNRVSAGAVLSNIGNKMNYTNDNTKAEFLPANIGIGLGYTKVFSDIHSLHIALDVNKLLVPQKPMNAKDSVAFQNYGKMSTMKGIFTSFSDAQNGFAEELKEITMSLGMEYNYSNFIFFRGGYFFQHADKGDKSFAALGLGLGYDVLSLDLSYLIPISFQSTNANQNPLSNTLRLGLSVNF